MQDDYFTEAEARAKVGRRVKTTVDFADVPAGTTAFVSGAEEASKGWTVVLRWNLPGKHLTDWFSRDEYTRWIEEL